MQEMSDATTGWALGAGAEFFRTLNALVEPAVRAGCASLGCFPPAWSCSRRRERRVDGPGACPCWRPSSMGASSSEPCVATGRSGFGTFARNSVSATGSPAASIEALPSSSPTARPDPRLRCFHLWPAPSPRACCRLRRPVAGSSRSSAPNAPGVVRNDPAAHRITLPERTTFSGTREPGITLSSYEASRGPSCATASVQMGSTAKMIRHSMASLFAPPK